MSGDSTALRHEPSAGVPEGRIRVLGRLDEMAVISSAWDSLAGTSAAPTQQYAWARCATDAFGLESQLSVVTVESGGRLTAVAPLFDRRSRSGYWEVLGAPELGEPIDFVHGDAGSLGLLAEALLQTRTPLRLARIRSDSPTLGALRQVCRGRALLLERSTSGCPFIPLDETWEEPERLFSPSHRSDLRRARRRAREAGALRFEFHAPVPSEVAGLLQEAYAVEASGWKGRLRTALAHEARVGSFFRGFARAASLRGWLRVAFLRLGGRAAAMQIGLELSGAYWLCKIGYDERYARCSPGHLLTLESIRRAAQRGLRAYEFLGREEPWIRRLTCRVRPCVSVRMHPRSLRVVGALAREGLAAGWQRSLGALRVPR